jgi:hypothetical protein
MNVDITLKMDVTEYAVMPKKINTKNIFNIQNNCLIISFCDEKENVLSQSEISYEDALMLANYINKLKP